MSEKMPHNQINKYKNSRNKLYITRRYIQWYKEELSDDNNQDFTRNILTNILMLNKYNALRYHQEIII